VSSTKIIATADVPDIVAGAIAMGLGGCFAAYGLAGGLYLPWSMRPSDGKRWV